MVCAILTRFRRARVGKAGERPALTRNCKRRTPRGDREPDRPPLSAGLPVFPSGTARLWAGGIGLAEMGLGGSHGF